LSRGELPHLGCLPGDAGMDRSARAGTRRQSRAGRSALRRSDRHGGRAVTRPFEVHPLEQAYLRQALFGIELLDAVTLDRVSTGVRVVSDGLRNRPFLNANGVFVWLDEDFDRLRTVTIDPGLLPYERVELTKAQLEKRRLNTVELAPRVDYAFE